MDIFVAGGHGKIALRFLKLAAARGDTARGLIRKSEQAADLEGVGAEPVMADWERGDDIRPLVKGADAVVFAAGAGPGSGPERKETVDHAGAVKLIEAARVNNVRRYVIISSMGAGDPASGPESMRPYLQAKAAADQAVMSSGLDFTIVRPGRLTDDPGTGRVQAAESLGRRGEIPRDDVAAVLIAVLDIDSTIGRTFELLSGEDPIEVALADLG